VYPEFACITYSVAAIRVVVSVAVATVIPTSTTATATEVAETRLIYGRLTKSFHIQFAFFMELATAINHAMKRRGEV
jgi:hypothetical protein